MIEWAAMPGDDDAAYFRARAVQEQDLAAASSCEEAALAHVELAMMYSALTASDDAGPDDPKPQPSGPGPLAPTVADRSDWTKA